MVWMVICLAFVAFDTMTTSTADASGIWSAATNVASTGQGISCANATFCVAIDHSGDASIYNGTSWSGPTLVDHTSFLYSVSCPVPSFCMAVDDAGDAFSLHNGTSWSAPTHIASTYVVSVSCPTASFCVAASAGDISVFNGTSWSGPTTVDASPHIFYAVSCPSSSFCVASDDSGRVFTYNGSSWSGPTSIDGNALLVSCARPSFCVANDYFGDVLTYSSGSWSAPSSIGSALSAMSCTHNALPSGSSFCAAVDQSGSALTLTGGSWSSPVSVDSDYLVSVSCPSQSFCATLDAHGNAFIYTDNGVDVVNCTGSCSGTVSTPATSTSPAQTIQVSGTTTAQTGTITIAIATDTLVCPKANPAQAPVVNLDDTGFAPNDKLKLTAVLHNTIRPKSQQVCFDSTIPYRSQSSPTVPKAGTGLLLKCGKTHNRAPCLKSSLQVGGDVIVTFYVPGGDPRFHVVAPPVAGIAAPTLPSATVGTTYSAKLNVDGGVPPFHWKVAGGALPPGLKMKATTGVISGKPTRKGTYSFSVTASDHEKPPQTATKALIITVN